MKDEDAMKKARQVVCDALLLPGLSAVQLALFSGMSVALCWAMETGNGTTLQDLIDGREVVRPHGR